MALSVTQLHLFFIIITIQTSVHQFSTICAAGEAKDIKSQQFECRIPCDGIWKLEHQSGEALLVSRIRPCFSKFASLQWSDWNEEYEHNQSERCRYLFPVANGNNFSCKHTPYITRNDCFLFFVLVRLFLSLVSTKNWKREHLREPRFSMKLERQWHIELTWMEA